MNDVPTPDQTHTDSNLASAPFESTAAAPEPPQKPKNSKVARWLTGGLTAVVLVGLGFLGGTLTAQNNSTAANQVPSNRQGGFSESTSAAQGGFTTGTITAINGDTITVQTNDGKSVTVTANDSTTVTQSSTGAVSDLATGDTIAVRGQETDGTVQAQSISEGELAQGTPGEGGPGQNGTAPGSSTQNGSASSSTQR